MKRCLIAVSLLWSSLNATVVNASSPISINLHISGDIVLDGDQSSATHAQRTFSTTGRTFWRAIGCSALIAYACACYCVQRTHWLMNDSTAWLNWNAALPLEQLLAQPHHEIFVALKQAIEQHYHAASLPIMIHAPQFLNETNAELDRLRMYVRVCTLLEKIPGALTICLVDQAAIRRAHDSIKRLIFLRSVLAQELEPKNMPRRLALINMH